VTLNLILSGKISKQLGAYGKNMFGYKVLDLPLRL
jgi:hypothetical protein